MSTNKSFRRDAIYERSHLFVPGDNVIVAFRIKGKISREALENSLQKVKESHPMINTHIEFDETHKAWFVSDKIPPCKLTIIPRTDDNTWIDAVLGEYFSGWVQETYEEANPTDFRQVALRIQIPSLADESGPAGNRHQRGRHVRNVDDGKAGQDHFQDVAAQTVPLL